MAYVSFENEISESILSKDNIKEGYYLATIIHSMIEVSKFSNEKEFVAVEEIKGLSFYRRFRLWDKSPSKRLNAHKEFKHFCEVLELNITFDEFKQKINFDSDVLHGKQIDACLTRFTTKDGKDSIWISTHAKAGTMSMLSKDEVWEPKESSPSLALPDQTTGSSTSETPFLDDSIPF